MRRALWAMTDDEVYVLTEQARLLLRDLYMQHTTWLAFAQSRDDRLNALKPSSPNYLKAKTTAWQAWKRVDAIEQRLQAQREYTVSLENEMAHRNPPFWTRADLEAINAYRDGIGKAGGGRGNGRRGGL